jgi:hypothetical protein
MGTALPEVVTYIISQFTSMAGTLLTEPLFLISVGFFVVGGVIGLVKRIL